MFHAIVVQTKSTTHIRLADNDSLAGELADLQETYKRGEVTIFDYFNQPDETQLKQLL